VDAVDVTEAQRRGAAAVRLPALEQALQRKPPAGGDLEDKGVDALLQDALRRAVAPCRLADLGPLIPEADWE